jgi:hypothetical protein
MVRQARNLPRRRVHRAAPSGAVPASRERIGLYDGSGRKPSRRTVRRSLSRRNIKANEADQQEERHDGRCRDTMQIGRGRLPRPCHREVRRFVSSVMAYLGSDTESEIEPMRRRAAYLGTAVVVMSVVLNLVHTASHVGQHLVALPAWQLAYITVVVYAAPVVAAILLWTRHRHAGAWLLAAAMAGSLVFGLLYHFVVPGPDNVLTQPPGPGRPRFRFRRCSSRRCR